MWKLMLCMVMHNLLVVVCKSLNDNSLTHSVSEKTVPITDMSNLCVDNFYTEVYLPLGMGVADSNVIMIADNDIYPNCIITYYSVGVEKGVYIIIVIEFPDYAYSAHKDVCLDVTNYLYIVESSGNTIDVCKSVKESEASVVPIYTVVSNATNVSVIIASNAMFEAIKITATSARYMDIFQRCDTMRETPCTVGATNTFVCISQELLCDKNLNCGTFNANDEDPRTCDESRYRLLWLVVLNGAALLAILAWFFTHVLRACLPKVPDSFFIFNEDEDNKLILATQFKPPEQPTADDAIETQATSSFRLKSIPLANEANRKTKKKEKPPLQTKDSVESVEQEVELQTTTYATDVDVSKPLPVSKEETTKKQRFKSDVHIADPSNSRKSISEKRSVLKSPKPENVSRKKSPTK